MRAVIVVRMAQGMSEMARNQKSRRLAMVRCFIRAKKPDFWLMVSPLNWMARPTYHPIVGASSRQIFPTLRANDAILPRTGAASRCAHFVSARCMTPSTDRPCMFPTANEIGARPARLRLRAQAQMSWWSLLPDTSLTMPRNLS